MIFLKTYTRIHPVDNQVLICVPAGTRVDVKALPTGRFHIFCDRPVTKNSASDFYFSASDRAEYLEEK